MDNIFYILTEIGGWGVWPSEVQAFLNRNRGKDVEIHINSPGGYIDDGVAIYNMLKNHTGKVTTRVISQAASIASVIFMAGEERIIENGAWLMVHKPWMYSAGNADDLRKNADYLDTMQAAIMEIYNTTGSGTPEEIEAMVDAETWLLGEDAMAHGFATQTAEKINAVACAISHDLSKYASNIPEALKRAENGTKPGSSPLNNNSAEHGKHKPAAETETKTEAKSMEIAKATAADIEKEAPGVYAGIVEAAKNEAVTAERSRLAGIKALAENVEGAPQAVRDAVMAKIDELCQDENATAENSAGAVMKAMAAAHKSVVATVGKGAQDLAEDLDDVPAGEDQEPEMDQDKQAENRANNIGKAYAKK